MPLTQFMNKHILNHPQYNDPKIEIDWVIDEKIIMGAIDKTMAAYFKGELNDNSIHDDYQAKGANHMKALIGALVQFQLISNKLECPI